MKKLVQFSVSHPVTTSMACAALILLGALGVFRLETSLLPDISYPRLTIVTRFADESPAGIEKRITKPVEEALSGVRGLLSSRATSSQGISVVRLTFGWKTDIDFAAMEVREKLDLVRNSLPQDARRPVVLKYDPNAAPLLMIACTPGSPNDKKLRRFIERNIKPVIRRVEGVGGVKISGGHFQEIQIGIDPGKLYAVQMALPDIVQLTARANFNTPAGPLPEGNKEVMVRTVGEFKKINNIGKVLIPGGEKSSPFPLSQLASITEGYRDRRAETLFNGKPAIGLSIFSESGANQVATASRARNTLRKLALKFGQRLKIETVVDRSLFISSAITDVSLAALIGGLLAFTVLVFFLKSIPEALILSLTIPVCAATTLFLMFISKISLNVISLGGLALGLGMTVDSGIVVIENIRKRLDNGEKQKTAVIEGTGEMAAPVFASILTSVAVFLPIVFVEGLSGRLFGQMALTVSFSLLISVLTALSFIPTAMFHLFSKQKQNKKTGNGTAWGKFISSIISKRKTVFMSSVLALCAAAPFFLFLEREFLPSGQRKILKARLKFPSDMSLSRKTAISRRFIKLTLAALPDSESFAEIGIDDTDPTAAASERSPSEAYISITIQQNDPPTAIQRISRLIKKGFDVPITIEADNTLIEGIKTDTASQLSIQIRGDNKAVARATKILINKLKPLKSIQSVSSDSGEKRDEIAIKIDRARSASLGVSVKDVAAAVRIALSGDVATKFRKGDRRIDVRVRFSRKFRTSSSDLNKIYLRTSGGGLVPISQLAHFGRTKTASRLYRVQGKRCSTTAVMIKQNMQRLHQYLKKLLKKLEQRFNIDSKIIGQDEESSNLDGLLFAFALAVLLIYMVLASQFEHFTMPLLVMISLPFSFIGSFLLLFLTGRSINVISAMGMVMLAGIAVNNAIVLYERFTLSIHHGLSSREAAVEATLSRTRPILMTTFTTLLAMLPLAIGGASLQRDLAIAVIGGLISSTALTLLLLPAFFSCTSGKKT